MISKIVFFGDSITAGNRAKDNELGDGFVFHFTTMLSDKTDLKNIQVINSGVNGHTIQDLLSRVDQDVIRFNPDMVVIKVGINDAYNDFISDSGDIHIIRFKTDYRRLITTLRSKLTNSQIFFLTPYYISDDKHDPLYLKMSEYIHVVLSMGLELGIPVLDAQKVFDEAVTVKPARDWAADQIHPGPDGHKLIAQNVFNFLINKLNNLK